MKKNRFIILIIISLSCVNLMAQADEMLYRYFFKVDTTYVMVDNSKGNCFTLEFKADTIYQIGNEQDENALIVYDYRKVLQVNVIPFSNILSARKKSVTIPKALQAYKKWELDYQQKAWKTKLKSGEEFYYREDKPFLIWWFKNPPAMDDAFEYDEAEEEMEEGTIVETKTLNVTHTLFLNFSIYGRKNVAFTIPVFEDENLEEEIEKLKAVANSLKVYGWYIDMDVLVDMKRSKEQYVLRDSLNFLELNVPEFLNVIRPIYDNMFIAGFPERHEVVNAMSMRWEYKSDSLTFNDFINRSTIPHKERADYRLIEKSDSVYRYFYTSDDGWFHHQCVYLKGDNVFCLIIFTATENTYDYNVGRFEEIIRAIKLK